MSALNILDCTFRDGGYYNSWDFSPTLIQSYLEAMKAAQVDIVELGFRFIKNAGFKGACAFTTDAFVRTLSIPEGLTVGVMLNGADLLTDIGLVPSLEKLFPETTATTPVQLVRFACHYHEFERVLPAVGWLSDRGYRVGFNLMQISDRTQEEIRNYARKALDWPVEVLYFADSMGGMTPDDVSRVIEWIRTEWEGPIGVHTHDNMGLALQNTLCAQAEGANWLDATVTGMGRGPGNARIEELAIEAEAIRGRKANLVPLLTLIRKYFRPLKELYGWGSNPYYYLSGKYGIHPTYVQEMLGDARYNEEDILAVIERLREEGGKKFSTDRLSNARNFYAAAPHGTWAPARLIAGREVLILGTGPGVAAHRPALEAYIRRAKPLVLALNTQSAIDPELIDLRAACHPVRLMADVEAHTLLPQPLITPASMLPDNLKAALAGKELLDFGLGVEPGIFTFHDTHCVAPTSLVLAYALAVAVSGKATRILMAGFDGYPAGDPRNDEINGFLSLYTQDAQQAKIVSISPTSYKALPSISIYGI
ncbi:4-hydroxy 2-oxovalerate aldolase [Pseudochelatococcus lubricantis]|uniref:4-hydroxy 2-oxovalerate aldolase n=1 Tax=Pseudochelatococcus lubricantis TaxID=1538102 RepID=A0ABX0V768_9HYPH|nr:aldolase catalytic domain-containing protein [Pseudochelatococcus lubricantis]NIJ60299.1 4-hydroxy 2-oxovalerate aldolase [Pseudochelatococcus lubricantis]